VTTLIQRMREELVRRNYTESTIRSYLHTIEDFRRYAQKRLDHLGRATSAVTRSTCGKSASLNASISSFAHCGPWRSRSVRARLYNQEIIMPAVQGSIALLDDPIAKELLCSKIPARLAYVWLDGSPRVVPVWFHWSGSEFVIGTPTKARN
jgi:hypothetical protein